MVRLLHVELSKSIFQRTRGSADVIEDTRYGSLERTCTAEHTVYLVPLHMRSAMGFIIQIHGKQFKISDFVTGS